MLEFSKRKLITKLILPAALPNLLLGARLSLGVAWVSLVVAELMGSTEGIGYMIMDARQFSNTDIVFVGIIIFAFVGKFSDSLVRLLEVKFLRWRDNFKGDRKLTYKLLGVIYIEYFSVCFNINKGCVKVWNYYGLFRRMEMVDI